VSLNNSPGSQLSTRLSLVGIVLSFFIYACAALLVHGKQRNDFIQERSSLSAAISYVIYDAPLGKVYSGVLAQFLNFQIPLDETLAQSTLHEVAPGVLLGSTADGNGIGYIVLTTLSIMLFGAHTYSPVILMLGLMAISGVAFLWRYLREYGAAVVLYFTSLTIMLFTPLVWNPAYSSNMSIGGIRYFSLAAILPAFHLVLEFFDAREWRQRIAGWKLAPMAIQVVILVLGILIRNGAALLIAVVGGTCLYVAWKNRYQRFATVQVLLKGGYMGAVAAIFVCILLFSVSKRI
jgi:hypothetical protein